MNLFDYKVLNEDEIMHVIDNSEYVQFAVSENDQPYVIPMCFKYKIKEDKLIFKLYGKPYGTKRNCIEKNSKVCLGFERETWEGIESAIILGEAKIINDENKLSTNLEEIEIITKEMTGRKYFYYKN